MKRSLFFLFGIIAVVCFGACATRVPAEDAPVPVVSVPVQASEPPEPPLIQEPEFSISAIVILQAELINTRFRALLRIDNPNSFPLELSDLRYELYGAGRYWAEGRESGLTEIPPEGYVEKKLFMSMNFMNMKREALDQVVTLKTVDYRFSGEVTVGAGDLPRFTTRFDKSGESPVAK
jgi:LEA14-like dessication related protein